MPDRQPNRLLAWERLQRGWSYEEVAERIRTEMTRCGDSDTGLTANTVRRWETGERRPDPRYRKHLVSIMGKPASELGLLTSDELRMRPDMSTSNEVEGLLEVLGRDTSGIDGLRRSLLRGLAAAGALPLLTPLLSLEGGGSRRPRDTIDPDTYITITECHRQLYWTTPARPLYEAAYAHAQLGVELVRGASGPTRARLASALAESAMLTARLALFDLRSDAVAERCLEVALAATRESGDHALAAAVLGHMAFRPIFRSTPADARDLLAAARQHTWHSVSPVIRSWLHCVASEAESRAGNAVVGRHEADLAAKALKSGDSLSQPAWMDFYGSARMHSFAGYAALSAGDNSEATVHLTQALANLTEKDGKQRSVVLADLARAHSGEIDQAADYLAQATDALSTDWYQLGFYRVRTVRPVLGDSRKGEDLDQRLDVLAATSPTTIPPERLMS